MTTRLYTHAACLDHDPGRLHPERPARLQAVLAALDGPDFADLERIEAPRAERAQIGRVHASDYVDALLSAVPEAGRADLDADTTLSPGSGEAALRAAGAVCAAVAAAVRGEAKRSFCAVRPPGHHAEATQAMGFCIFNNVAVGAAEAIAQGLDRVAVVDFDVHHGNGTQHMFERDSQIFFASTHQWPLYPGTGAAGETGIGNVVNAPLPPLAGSAEFRQAMTEKILPALDRFRPDLILISAGFDAHWLDPLGSLNLDEADYAWITGELCRIADRHAKGRVVSTLEGGYDLDALAASAAAHVKALMDWGKGS
ncbi:MAG: histone deacetylase family protein [Alphaproteobacteria bacterium]|nr:histone deacetylase family protein [Alphaproteobacteria bacterium]